MPTPEKPNVLFIMPDQLRADFLSCYGAHFIDTTHIDALATESAIYERAYSPHPVCVPARIALMTGMDAIKNGVCDNGQMLRTDYVQCGISTWPEILTRAGYNTVAIGKMNFMPWEARCGFGRRVIAEDKIWINIEDDYHHFLRAHGYRKTIGFERDDYHRDFGAFISDIPWEYSVDHFVGEETVRWINEYDGSRPFALMVGFPGPHYPYDPAPEFASAFAATDMPEPIPELEGNTRVIRGDAPPPAFRSWYAFRNAGKPTRSQFLLQRAYYAALVKQIDYEIGAILDALRGKGILDQTAIILTSDHGDYIGDHGLQGKDSFFEAATRVPLTVRLPSAACAARRQELVSLTDVTATILALAGCPIPTYMDSIALPGLGLHGDAVRDCIVGSLRHGWMLRREDWKLMKYPGGSLLFNLREDPLEQHNLGVDSHYAHVFQSLDAQLVAAIMAAINAGHFDKRVYEHTLSGDPDFGRPGWPRKYPASIESLEGT